MSKNETIKVASIQQSCCDHFDTNLDNCIKGISEAAEQGAKLVLLPELHNSSYFCQTKDIRHFDLAETIPGPSSKRLSQVARQWGIVIICSIFEERAPGLYHNTAVILDTDGSIAGLYRKMHIPDDPGYYEKFYFTPGDLGFKPIQTSIGRLGVLICWDQWFPEAARLMRMAGADMLLFPTAIGWDPIDITEEKKRQLDAWQIVQRGHAISNNLPVICCNRVGFEASGDHPDNGITFWGSSFMAGPQGEILAEAPFNKACVLVADIDLIRNYEVSNTWPFLRDRRIDSYQDLLRRFID